jgi:hypothetical protein
MPRKPVKGNHPLAEVIAKCLFGIETVPKEYMRRMVNRACREAVKWHQERENKVLRDVLLNFKDTDEYDDFNSNFDM